MHNKVLVTPRIKEEISNIHFLFMNELIEDMEVQRDYLQVFILKASAEGLQEIEHSQKEPSYKKVYQFYTTHPVNGTICVAIEEKYSVMMFSD